MRFKGAGSTYAAVDAAGLRRLIEQFDAIVPDRAEGRAKEQVEQYMMARVLHELAASDIEFPLEVIHQDRPDFLLCMPRRQIGIELVEASSTNEIRKNARRASETSLSTYFVEPGVPGEVVKTAEVLRAELAEEVEAEERGELLGDGSVGAPWPEWAKAMAHFIGNKVTKASKAGFERFPENWLVIYDNWPMVMTTPKPERMYKALCDELVGSSCFETFDRVYIISNRLLFDVSAAGYRVNQALDRTPKPTWLDRQMWFLWEIVENLCSRVRSR